MSAAGFAGMKLPPQNLEAEIGVLGSILLDNDVLHEIIPTLTVDDFYRDAHQIMFRAIRDLYDVGKAVDAITLADELTRLGKVDEVGGIEFIAEVVNGVPHALNARYYADIVRQRAVLRAGIEVATVALDEAYGCAVTAETFLEHFQDAVIRLGARGAADSVTSLVEPVGLFLDTLTARKAGPSGVRSPWADLDDMTDGWQPGSLYLIAGRPSTGKSTVALCAASAAAAAGVPGLFFSLEMRAIELAERLVCARSGLPNVRLRQPESLTPAEVRDLGDAVDALNGLPLLIDDTPSRTIASIQALARKYHASHGVRMVWVDYLQLISMEDGSRDSRQEHVARVSRALKVLARSLNIPVVCMASMNRAPESREDRRPRMSDMRESGAIESDADVVILTHRPDRYNPADKPGLVELIVDKNRHGRTGTVDLLNQYDRFRLAERLPDGVLADGPAF